MSEWALKRFWKETQVTEIENGFAVTLDGRNVKTPAKAGLIVPTRRYAEMMAAEWEAQQDVVDPNTMPFTRTANSAIDKVAHQQAEVAEMLAAYGDSDLLCYRADGPQELIDRQIKAWDPLLDWADTVLGARLAPRTGVMHQPQDAGALARLSAETHALGPFELAAFHDLVSLTGSLILGFATIRNYGAADEIWPLSRIDEDWQIEQWGADDEAAETEAIKRASFLHAATCFSLVAQARC